MADPSFWSQAAPWVWDNRKEVIKLLKKTYRWLTGDGGDKAPQRDILILGPGGVGKSTLAYILSGQFNWLLDEPWNYKESYGIEDFTLKDNDKIAIAVMPGQVVRRNSTWKDIKQKLAAGHYRGVIIVGAYGYHAIPELSYKDHPIYRGSKSKLLSDLREAFLADELNVLRDLCLATATCAKPIWLLSVVTKQDLWWKDREQCTNYYRHGEYAEIVAKLIAEAGNSRIRFEQHALSLVIGNYRTRATELLKPNEKVTTSICKSKLYGDFSKLSLRFVNGRIDNGHQDSGKTNPKFRKRRSRPC